MAREHPDFRPLLEQMNRVFGDREYLSSDDVTRFTGMKSVNTVKKHFSMKNGRIKKVTLAREMCQ